MADVQITDLTAAPDMNSGDLFLIRQGSTDKKLTRENLETSLVLNLPNIDGSLIATGTDTYSITGVEDLTSYATGIIVQARFTLANTGASTVNLNGIGAIDLVTVDNQPLDAGNIKASGLYFIVYVASPETFQLINIPDSTVPRKDLEETITSQWTFTTGDTTSPIMNTIQFATGGGPSNRDELWYNDTTDTYYLTSDTTHKDDSNTTTTLNVGHIRLTNTADVTVVSTNHAFQIGPFGGLNLAADSNEIQVRSNGIAAPLNLNRGGGDIQLGDTLSANIFIDNTGEVSIDRVGGLQKFSTRFDGIDVFGSLNNVLGGNQDTEINFRNATGTTIAALGFIDSDANFEIRNLNNGGDLILSANDVGGSVKNILAANPDGATILTADIDLSLRVNAGEDALVATANGSVRLFHDTLLKLGTITEGMEIFGSLNNAPGGAQNTTIDFNNSSGTPIAEMGFIDGNTNFGIRSLNEGGQFILSAEDSGGTSRSILIADPDTITILIADSNLTLRVNATEDALFATANGSVKLFHANEDKLETTVGGIELFGSLMSAPGGSQDTTIDFNNSGGAQVASVGFVDGDANFEMRSLNNGGNLILSAHDTGGTIREILSGDPDGNVNLSYIGVPMARTAAIGSGGLEVNNTVTGTGFERALTTSDLNGQVFNAVKTADTTRTSASIIADPHLTIALPSSGRYRFQLYVEWQNIGARDIALEFNVSSGSFSSSGGLITSSSSASQVLLHHMASINTAFTITNVTITLIGGFTVTGHMDITAAATFSFDWGLGSAGSPGIPVRAGSWLNVVKLA